MLFEHLIEDCLASEIGEGGLSEETFERTLAATEPALARLRAARDAGSLALLTLPGREDDLAACKPMADLLADNDHVVVLGTGGSSLGGRAVVSTAVFGYAGPPIRFMDNIDPTSFANLLADLDLKQAGFLVISKSGGTAEPLAQFLILLPMLRAAVGDAGLARKVAVVTDPSPSPLRRLAERYGLPCLDHEPGIGGRYSVLSNVGLLPAMIAGLDPAELRAGAAATLKQSLDAPGPAGSPPALGAAISVGLMNERRISQTVLMPYVDRLNDFALWYRQLWAESLGKDGLGTTPINALGAVDQHSQLQLYLAGPRDKMFTLIILATAGDGFRVDPALADDEALAYLRGQGLGDLLQAMARATADTLARNGHPTRVIKLARLDERVLGGLFMHFMLETLIAAELLGVNAFDQPAVEESKVLARKYLSEAGR